MTRPEMQVTIHTTDGLTTDMNALFDTGSFQTIVRADRLPDGAPVFPLAARRAFRTASAGGTLLATGITYLIVDIGRRMIETSAFVAPDLSRDLIIGAGAMQKWDVTVENVNGRTEVHVGRDMRDPGSLEIV